MIVPREHGAWGMLLVPLVTGAVVAAGHAMNPLALSLLLIVALALFWLRTTVEAWVGTSAIKAHTPRERRIVLSVASALSLVAVIAIASLFRLGYLGGLLIIGAVAALSFIVQAIVKRLGRRARMLAQIIGAVGLTSTAASAYYVATGQLNSTAVALWAANWLFACNQVHFVQLRIHAGRANSLGEKLQHGSMFLIGQSALFVAAALLSAKGIFPKYAMMAFLPVVIRGTAWFFCGPRRLDVHRLGFSELFQSILFGTLLCTAFMV